MYSMWLTRTSGIGKTPPSTARSTAPSSRLPSSSTRQDGEARLETSTLGNLRPKNPFQDGEANLATTTTGLVRLKPGKLRSPEEDVPVPVPSILDSDTMYSGTRPSYGFKQSLYGGGGASDAPGLSKNAAFRNSFIAERSDETSSLRGGDYSRMYSSSSDALLQASHRRTASAPSVSNFSVSLSNTGVDRRVGMQTMYRDQVRKDIKSRRSLRASKRQAGTPIVMGKNHSHRIFEFTIAILWYGVATEQMKDNMRDVIKAVGARFEMDGDTTNVWYTPPGLTGLSIGEGSPGEVHFSVRIWKKKRVILSNTHFKFVLIDGPVDDYEDVVEALVDAFEANWYSHPDYPTFGDEK
jgi:hypothetical protein